MYLDLNPEAEKRLMDQYAELTAFEYGNLVLRKLKERGICTPIPSKGSRQILANVVENL